MGLARMLPRTEVLVVTTPPLAAQKVAARAADMARKGHLRVAGVIENMSAFTCDHGTTYPLFGEGGGARSRPRSACPWWAPSRSTPTWPPPGTPAARWRSAPGALASPSTPWPPDRRGHRAGGREVGLHGPAARGCRPRGRPPGDDGPQLRTRPPTATSTSAGSSLRAGLRRPASADGPTAICARREPLVVDVGVDVGTSSSTVARPAAGRGRRPRPPPVPRWARSPARWPPDPR